MERLPTPRYVAQTSDALGEVGYPPPPARVEIVPPRPRPDAVWIDGEWMWQGRRWAWRPGRWVVPPPNAAFSPWTATRDANGTLYYAPGTWRDESGKAIESPPAIATAHLRGGTVVNAEGEAVPAAPLVREEAARLEVFDAAVVDAGALDATVDASAIDSGVVDANLSDVLDVPDVLPESARRITR
jgi:hypothetical protein